MNEREALKLALEAFEWNYNTDLDNIPACEKWAKMLKENITAIKEALAQPEQEPVAWLIWLHGPAGHFDHKQFAEMEFERRNKEYPDPDRKLLPLYTTPPQRKPLSDEEIYKIANDLFYGNGPCDTLAMCRAIEAAHGIKGKA